MNFKNGDSIIVEGKCFRIIENTLIPEEESYTLKYTPLKELKGKPAKEFLLYGSTCMSDSDISGIAVYLGTKDNSKRYYHELRENTLVHVLD